MFHVSIIWYRPKIKSKDMHRNDNWHTQNLYCDIKKKQAIATIDLKESTLPKG
jgi:hypothetical protein